MDTRSQVNETLDAFYGSRIQKWKDEELEKSQQVLQRVMSMRYGSPFVKSLLLALHDAGCPMIADENLLLGECPHMSPYIGLFIPQHNMVILCQDKFRKMKADQKRMEMEKLLSHELVHAYDYCRAHVDPQSPSHGMCTEIRAATLSGECMLKHQKTSASFSGLKGLHQQCVRNNAMQSFLYSYPSWTNEEAEKLMTRIFSSCYNDRDPFDRIPLTKNDANLSFKAFATRNRYNIA